MNKKFTFMVAALLAAGSVFALDTDRKVTEFAPGRAYYLEATGYNGTSGTAATVVKGGATLTSVLSSNVTNAAVEETAQWIIEKKTDNTYTIKNASTGDLLSFDKPESSYVYNAKGEGKYNEFYIVKSESNYNIQLAVGGAAQYLTIKDSESQTCEISGTADAFSFYEAYNTAVSQSDLQDIEGTKFTLNFGASEAEGDSIFVEVSAVTVGTAIDGVDFTSSTLSGSFLFMVSGKATDGVVAKADFNAAKFVYLTKNRVENSLINDEVTGYRYDVISGEDLLKAIDDEKMTAKEAVFTAYTSLNQDGYIFKQADVFGKTGKTVWLNTIDGVVASQLEEFSKSPVVIEVGKGTRVAASSVANEQMKVVNVTASVEDEDKVYAYGLAKNNGNVELYSKKSEASLGYPSGQWLVTAGTTENTITLVNIQDPAEKIENIALYEAEGENTYAVKLTSQGTGSKNVESITLTEVANYNKENGYLNLEDVAGQTYILKTEDKFTFIGNEEVEAYVKLNDGKTAFATTPFADQAGEWTITKVLEAEKTNADTLKVKTTYKYFDAEGKAKEVKDEVLRYAFKYNLAIGDNSLDNTDFGADGGTAETVLLRQMSKDKYAIVTSADGTTISASVKITSNAFAKTSSADLTDAATFYIELADAAPSMEATSKHMTFAINGLNYIAMDANGNGVVANETSTLKAATVEDFTFWVDSVDADAATPAFFISKGDKMMVNGSYVVKAAQDAYDYDEITEAEMTEIKDAAVYGAEYTGSNDVYRVKFTAATRAEGDTLMINDKKVVDNAFKFNILENEDGGYVLRNGANYVSAINDQLIFTNVKDDAVVVEVADAQAPTSNEGVVASEVKVIANNGSVVVKNAAGKNVVVSTILGQVVANEVLTSDNATINVPAGIVVVAVEGESFKINVR